MACSAQLCRDHGSGGKETAGRVASAKSLIILPGFATNVSRFRKVLYRKRRCSEHSLETRDGSNSTQPLTDLQYWLNQIDSAIR
jgi:hypothetical protein